MNCGCCVLRKLATRNSRNWSSAVRTGSTDVTSSSSSSSWSRACPWLERSRFHELLPTSSVLGVSPCWVQAMIERPLVTYDREQVKDRVRIRVKDRLGSGIGLGLGLGLRLALASLPGCWLSAVVWRRSSSAAFCWLEDLCHQADPEVRGYYPRIDIYGTDVYKYCFFLPRTIHDWNSLDTLSQSRRIPQPPVDISGC